MKKLFFFLLALSVFFVGCNKPETNNTENTTVTLNFKPYSSEPMRGNNAMTDINVVDRLDVWIVNNSDTIVVNQNKADAGNDFGTIEVELNNTKTYTLYAVGHKADGIAIMNNGVIRFTNEKVTQSMYCTTTFSPSTSSSISCTMDRIVGMFKFVITDELPSNVNNMKFTISSSGTRFNVVDNEAANYVVREVVPSSMNPNNLGQYVFNIYIMADNLVDTKNVDINVEAFDNTNNVIESRLFEDVGIKDGWVTKYQGTFFVTTDLTITFDIDDWEFFPDVNF